MLGVDSRTIGAVTERISLLRTVKAYPAIGQQYGEVVCLAGIRTDTPAPAWVRLYPVAFRELPFAQRFKKYQYVSLEASKHGSDQRPETYRPKCELAGGRRGPRHEAAVEQAT
jgi:hypothetical protein